MQSLFCWLGKCSGFNGNGSGSDLGSGMWGPVILAALLESDCVCGMTLTVFVFWPSIVSACFSKPLSLVIALIGS